MKISKYIYHCLVLQLHDLGQAELVVELGHPAAQRGRHAEGDPLHLLSGHRAPEPPDVVLDGPGGGD